MLKKALEKEDSMPDRKLWVERLCKYMDHCEAEAKRGIQTAKLGLEQTGEMLYANQLAYWEDIQSATMLFKFKAKSWARKNIK